jgi:uncharacterized protein YciI
MTLLFSVLFALSFQSQPRYPPPVDMKTFHIVMLMRGPAAQPGAPVMAAADLQKLQEAHLAHITKLAKEGHATIAGPMDGTGDLRGIIIMKTPTAEAARALVSEDPSVKAGRLRIEVVSYMTPAAWFSFGPIKDDFPMRHYFFGFLNNGPKADSNPAETQKVMDDHLANLWAIRDVGALVMAGPVSSAPVAGQPVHAGMFVIAVDTPEKAKALLEQDPAVKSGRFVIEMYKWFAADGIMKGR